jgi:GT2 family glycosyltransferase
MTHREDKSKKLGSSRFRLCFIIPTKDRPFELGRLFSSISNQGVLPSQMVVVDGGEPGVKNIVEKFPRLPIDYIQVHPPGLTRQRNAGLNAVRKDIDLVGFLDDDIVLEADCIKNLLDFWEHAPADIGGTGLNIIDNIYPSKPAWFFKLFFIRDGNPGHVLKSGRNVPYCPAQKTHEVQWLCGGATVWLKKVFEKFTFDEWYSAWGIGDDVDFSYRAGREYSFMVVSDAKVRHLETGIPPERQYLRAYIATMNNMYFAQKHREFSKILSAWSFFGQGVAFIIKGLIIANGPDLKRGMGHVAASLKGLLFGIKQVNRQVKN